MNNQTFHPLLPFLVLPLLFMQGCLTGCSNGELTVQEGMQVLKDGNAKGELSLDLSGNPEAYLKQSAGLGPHGDLHFEGEIDYSRPPGAGPATIPQLKEPPRNGTETGETTPAHFLLA